VIEPERDLLLDVEASENNVHSSGTERSEAPVLNTP